jgi:hypothetical protein
VRKNPERFFKEDGSPKYLRCYEVKRNPTLDRFTVVFGRASCFMGKEYIGRVYYVGASGNPRNPISGFYQHGEAWAGEFHAPGSRVAFSSLPLELQEVVREEYNDVWGVK